MGKLINFAVIGVILVFGNISNFWAATINYNESIDGSLPESIDSVTAGDFLTLGFGTNQWTGNLLRAAGSGAVFDTMAFTVPNDALVSEIRLTTGNFQITSGNWSTYQIYGIEYTATYSRPPQEGYKQLFIQPELEQNQTSVLQDFLPVLTEGNYSLCLCGTSYSFGVLPASFDYHVEIDLIDTSVVPIPPAVWLFSTGLLGLIGVAKRKANA